MATKSKTTTLSKYEPLIMLVLGAEFGALAMELSHNSFDGMRLMSGFMGLFFLIFAQLKLMDLKGFVTAFRKYDIIAQDVPRYATFYPFIELALGMLYLSHAFPYFTNLFTLVFMLISAAGVMRALDSKTKMNCACMGTSFKLPLGTVSLIEYVTMGIMAGMSLITMQQSLIGIVN